MKLTRLFVLAFAVLPLVPDAAAPAPVPPDAKITPKVELARLAGTWKVVSYQRAGVETISDGDNRQMLITFAEDGTFEWVKGAGGSGKIARIDPSTKIKEVDYTYTGSDDRTDKAIYKLEGDTFTDCFIASGDERPTEFKSTKENGYTLMVYKRVKKDN